jgi:hypothetical protein
MLLLALNPHGGLCRGILAAPRCVGGWWVGAVPVHVGVGDGWASSVSLLCVCMSMHVCSCCSSRAMVDLAGHAFGSAQRICLRCAHVVL